MRDIPSCTNCGEYPGEKVADEIERLRVALHVTITRPAGVVPDVALEFYDPHHPALGRMQQTS